MYIKCQEVAIDEVDPFKNDKLNRRTFSDQLKVLVDTLTQPVVIALDGAWGSGKSTFIRMWMPSLIQHGHLCVLFNAWENDFADDPLIPLIAAVDEQIQPSAKSATWTKAKKLASHVSRIVTPLVVKVATAGIIGSEEIKQIISLPEDTGSDSGEAVGEAVRNSIDEHARAAKTVKAFRTTLAKFASEVSQRPDGTTRSLVIIIDELDRCKPPFAISLLERIKHLFNVERCVFILAVDKSQLRETVRFAYGSGTDVDGYLRRFIDVTCSLPPAPTDLFVRNLFAQLALPELLEDSDEAFRDLLAGLFDGFCLPLRAQEQIVAELNVAIRLVWVRNTPVAPGLAVLILAVLRAINAELYSSYTRGSASGSEVFKYLTSRANAIRRDHYGTVEGILEGLSAFEGEADEAHRFTQEELRTAPENSQRKHDLTCKSRMISALWLPKGTMRLRILPALNFSVGK